MFIPPPFNKLKRGPQVVLPKDAAMIVAYAGIESGYRVVDAGSGSGWLAIFLGRLVKPEGKVVSYERRREFAEIARKNVKKLGLERWVEIKEKDITKGIDEREIDVITLDIPEPWNVLAHAKSSLKRGGRLVSYLPTIEQVKRLVKEGEEAGFSHVVTVESIVREIKVSENATRPKTRGLMHTGYIVIMKCILKQVDE